MTFTRVVAVDPAVVFSGGIEGFFGGCGAVDVQSRQRRPYVGLDAGGGVRGVGGEVGYSVYGF